MTSMYVGGDARYFGTPSTIDQIQYGIAWAREQQLPVFILGGGNNILVSDKGFDGVVLQLNLKGVQVKSEDDKKIEFEIGASENWDEFVAMCVGKGYYGIENLSHIPGSVGASVVQNIGAYGQEVGDCLISVTAYDTNSEEIIELAKSSIDLGYRKSRFNQEDKGRFIILSVKLRLSKDGELNTRYGDVQKYFASRGIDAPTLSQMRRAIIEIRDAKFPYPDKPEQGNTGSFFNAEIIDEQRFDAIREKFLSKGMTDKAEYMSRMKSSFKVSQGYKVPFSILIESLGFKGSTQGGAKVLETHAGVLCNFTGQATAQDIYTLAQRIIKAVYDEYGVILQPEPELIGDFS